MVKFSNERFVVPFFYVFSTMISYVGALFLGQPFSSIFFTLWFVPASFVVEKFGLYASLESDMGEWVFVYPLVNLLIWFLVGCIFGWVRLSRMGDRRKARS